MPLEAALSVLPYFAALRADERLRIADRFRVLKLDPGERFQIFADAPQLTIIVEGAIELAVADAAPTLLFAGTGIGELGVVTGRGPDERLTATLPTTLAVLDRPALDALYVEFPAIAPPWVAELARELKWRND